MQAASPDPPQLPPPQRRALALGQAEAGRVALKLWAIWVKFYSGVIVRPRFILRSPGPMRFLGSLPYNKSKAKAV